MTRATLWFLVLASIAVAISVLANSEPAVQYVAAIAAMLVVFVWWFLIRGRRRRIRSWQDAETATARWLRRVGCRRVALTGASADGGIDVVTTDWAVQVKHRAKRVGRPAVQQLVGAALDLNRAPALFSTSGFSAPAIEYANDHEVALFDLHLDGSAQGINQAARRVGTRRRRLALRY